MDGEGSFLIGVEFEAEVVSDAAHGAAGIDFDEGVDGEGFAWVLEEEGVDGKGAVEVGQEVFEDVWERAFVELEEGGVIEGGLVKEGGFFGSEEAGEFGGGGGAEVATVGVGFEEGEGEEAGFGITRKIVEGGEIAGAREEGLDDERGLGGEAFGGPVEPVGRGALGGEAELILSGASEGGFDDDGRVGKGVGEEFFEFDKGGGNF